ncbi:MAG: sulfatase-like hydrolase/transferase, partial [Bryobacteraceae bacterium]
MITRRGFLSSSLKTAALAPTITTAAAKSKQNVLFIAIDDLNDWVGCLGGHPGVHTPNLDKLASQGVLFRSAHCAAPLCNPARTALMTGRRPSSTGVYTNSQPYHGSKPLADAVTMN